MKTSFLLIALPSAALLLAIASKSVESPKPQKDEDGMLATLRLQLEIQSVRTAEARLKILEDDARRTPQLLESGIAERERAYPTTNYINDLKHCIEILDRRSKALLAEERKYSIRE